MKVKGREASDGLGEGVAPGDSVNTYRQDAGLPFRSTLSSVVSARHLCSEHCPSNFVERRWKFSTGRMKLRPGRGKSNILWYTEAITNSD